MPTFSDAFPDVNPALLEAITTAVWQRNAQRLAGGEVRFGCPSPEHHANGDEHPSCRWSPAKYTFYCDVCGVGGGARDLAQRLGIATSTEIIYEIRDLTGALVALHVRIGDGAEKRLSWRRPTGELGLGGLPVTALPLFSTEALAAAPRGARVIITEGEKAADSLAARGFLALGTVTGASTIPADDVLRALSGFDVVLWCDADAIGRRHMARIAARLRVLQIACRWLDPWPQQTAGEDAADFVGTDAELVALLDGATDPGELPDPFPTGVVLHEVAPELVQWLWEGRLPRGKVVIVEGQPDVGKTTVMLDLAARVSTGAAFPFETETRPPAGVVVLSAEDGLADTIVPRLRAAGADLHRIVSTKPEDLPTFDAEGLAYVRRLIDRVDAQLVAIDPLVAFVPDSIDTHSDHRSRRLLRALAALAEETKATILVTRHLRKGLSVSAKDAGGGSVAFTAAARVVLLAAVDPVDDDQKVLARTKGNLSAPFSALAYRLVAHGFSVMVDWIGPTEHTADQLLAQPTEPEELSALEEAKAAVLDLLTDGSIAAELAIAKLKKRGIAEKTWKRAKAVLGVLSKREGFGRDGVWSWMPPTHSGAKESTDHPPQNSDPLSDSDPLCSGESPIGGQDSIEGQDFVAGEPRPSTPLNGETEGATVSGDGKPPRGGRRIRL